MSVSVPVLSELIADVEPSVSVERSRFMIAFAFARVCVPIERIAVTTAGSPVGIAAMANAIAARKTSLKVFPGREEFQRPFFILLNMAVGGNWPGNPNHQTMFPQSMYVDWVRVYQ